MPNYDPILLAACLDYAPLTGRLTWKHRDASTFINPSRMSAAARANRFNNERAGSQAFKRTVGGYHVGKLNGEALFAHRVAFAIGNMFDAPEQVDHINGDCSDNRLINLRAVPHIINSRNGARHRTNTSGFTGVSWSRRQRKWRSYITDDVGRRRWLGYFNTPDEASAARHGLEIELQYHPNHGRDPWSRAHRGLF